MGNAAVHCVSTIALAVTLIVTTACDSTRTAAEVRPLRITTGSQIGPNNQIGRALARLYEAEVPGTKTSLVLTKGSAFNVQALEDGTAEIAISRADVAYLAFRRGTQSDPRAHRSLRAMAVLHVNAVQIVAAGESDIRRVGDLKGKRVGIGLPEQGTDVIGRLILEAAGLTGHVDDEVVGTGRFAEMALDAVVVVAGYPTPNVEALNSGVGVRLIPIDPALTNRVRAQYPFFHPIVIPQGTYDGQDEDVATIGVDGLLLCRSDLPDDLVYQLTSLFMQSLSRLTLEAPVVGLINPERSASAPIPLHPGAARFYRERELFR